VDLIEPHEHGFAYRLIIVACSLLGVSFSIRAWAQAGVPDRLMRPRHLAAAVTSESTRQPAYNDFLRLIYANLPSPPTTLGAPSAYRVFFGATAFYEPPIPVAQIANFSGIPVNPDVNLYVLRCIPPEGSRAEPTLALWPNLIAKIEEDYETNPPTPDTPDAAIQTIADSFSDTKSPVLDVTLANALNTGQEFFESYPPGTEPPEFDAATMQAQMSKRFGTFPAFTGLGYAAEGTSSSPSLDSEQAMRAMVIPDFVLKNVTLADAGCHCIVVPPGVRNRDQRKLDPAFVWRAGGDGQCRTVRRLSNSDW
jgi:hypothetical protein